MFGLFNSQFCVFPFAVDFLNQFSKDSCFMQASSKATESKLFKSSVVSVCKKSDT